MFAGPNGSGKSTLKSVLPVELLGVYINPDEIEREVRTTGILNFEAFGITGTSEKIRDFFVRSVLLQSAGLNELIPTRA
jgi:ABC-type molybdenum transport system ATPase subunit/photorepair protein PhrA